MRIWYKVITCFIVCFILIVYLDSCDSSTGPDYKININYDLLKEILSENGITAETKEKIFEHLSADPADTLKEYFIYRIIIPHPERTTLVLSENIHLLSTTDNHFRGVETPASSNLDTALGRIETLIIKTETRMKITTLNVGGNKLRYLPDNIGLLEGHVFWFDRNKLDDIPEEVMLIPENTSGWNPDAVVFSVRYNDIDTLNVSDSLHVWLDLHSERTGSGPKPPWWITQSLYDTLTIVSPGLGPFAQPSR